MPYREQERIGAVPTAIKAVEVHSKISHTPLRDRKCLRVWFGQHAWFGPGEEKEKVRKEERERREEAGPVAAVLEESLREGSDRPR